MKRYLLVLGLVSIVSGAQAAGGSIEILEPGPYGEIGLEPDAHGEIGLEPDAHVGIGLEPDPHGEIGMDDGYDHPRSGPRRGHRPPHRPPRHGSGDFECDPWYDDHCDSYEDSRGGQWQCVAQNLRGRSFFGVGYSQSMAKQRALQKCANAGSRMCTLIDTSCRLIRRHHR